MLIGYLCVAFIIYILALQFVDVVFDRNEEHNNISKVLIYFMLCWIWPIVIFPFLGWLYLKYVKK